MMINNDNYISNIDICSPELTFEVETIAKHQPIPDWKWDHISTNHDNTYLLWLVTGGEAFIKSSFGDFSLQCGDALIMPFTNCEYHGRQNINKLFEVMWIIFKIVDTSKYESPCIRTSFYATSLPDLSFAIKLANRILLSNKKSQGHWLRVLLEEIQQQAKRKHINETEIRINNLCNKIKTHPELYRNIDALQQEFHYSKDHLIRLFRQYKNLTPGEFIIQSRIEKAKGLLLMSSFSIKQIATQLGYSNQFSFSKQFKQRIGLAPKEFRQDIVSITW